MRVARDAAGLAAGLSDLRKAGGTVALVPTMGALHPGHVSLLAVGREAARHVAASIFVNPTQFAPGEDFASYPRDEAGDLAKLDAAGCDLAWLPSTQAIYPPGDATTIKVAGPALGFEAAARPNHFAGVATVVARLFGHVRPEVAVFGEKDWQQVLVVRRLVADLALGVRIEMGPVMREADGLAMSSRNRFLDAAARARAPLLASTLHAAVARLRQMHPARQVLAQATAALRESGFTPDYVCLIEGGTMRELDTPVSGARLVAAARLGGVRLLDTVAV